jgi:hypothetical protein
MDADRGGPNGLLATAQSPGPSSCTCSMPTGSSPAPRSGRPLSKLGSSPPLAVELGRRNGGPLLCWGGQSRSVPRAS